MNYINYITMLTAFRLPDNADFERVLSEYFSKQSVSVARLYGGHSNLTYTVTSGKSRYILQRLSPASSGQVLLDTDIALRHLSAEGWEIQSLIHTKHDQLTAFDAAGHQWRLLTYLPADPVSERRLDTQTAWDSGRMLANLHASLLKLVYMPAAAIPYFHDTAHYAQQLEVRIPRLPLTDLRNLATELLAAYSKLPPMPFSGPQLIHGDPRVSNVLFRKGRPFSFIDFDTMIQGNIWTDLGDLLRSVNGNDEQTKVQFSIERTRHIIEGYRLRLASDVPAEQFLQWALIAIEHMCVELAMRFLIDIVDDDHFDWDSDQYVSRAANNLARAQAQWEIYAYAKHYATTSNPHQGLSKQVAYS